MNRPMTTLLKTRNEMGGVWGGCLAVLVATLASASLATGQSPKAFQAGTPSFQVLYSFTGGTDGAYLPDSVVLDPNGNIYGITGLGGAEGVGTVFELTPEPNNQWKKATLYDFQQSGPNTPNGGLILDGAGNLYGTTTAGGTNDRGVVFELTPNGGGWDLSALYDFGPAGSDACCPWGKLLMDRLGNLYGAGGAAFELSPLSGAWLETTLHDFNGQNGDGYSADASVISDQIGHLYGTTTWGGGSSKCPNFGCGTVYKLVPVPDESHAVWREQILHAFGYVQGDGVEPGVGSLALNARGQLFGTTLGGGTNGAGIVFGLTRSATPRWQESILHNFNLDANGYEPAGGITLGRDGALYGTTIAGGSPRCGCGVIYKLSPQPDGRWQYTVLHTFAGFDGAEPDANLTIDSKGNLYGTTLTGGPGGAGVVFEITP